MKLLTRLVASLFTTVLVGTIIGLAFNGTLLNSHYLEGQAAAANVYSQLSTALQQEVLTNSNLSGAELAQTQATLQQVVTPGVLQTKINQTLDEFQDYYKGNGDTPTVNLSDIATQLQAAGVQLPQGTDFSKPITITPSPKARTTVHGVEGQKLDGIWASIVLLAALVLLCIRTGRYTPIANAIMATGIWIGLTAGILALLPGIVSRYVKFDFASNGFVAAIHDLALHIARDQAVRLGMMAGGLLVLGIILRIVLHYFVPGHAAKTGPIASLPTKQPTKTV